MAKQPPILQSSAALGLAVLMLAVLLYNFSAFSDSLKFPFSHLPTRCKSGFLVLMRVLYSVSKRLSSVLSWMKPGNAAQ